MCVSPMPLEAHYNVINKAEVEIVSYLGGIIYI